MASKSKSQAALVLLLLLSTMAMAASAGVYTVSGQSGPGWGFGAQSSMPTLNPGDTVHFQYSPGVHNVVEVSQSDFDNCLGSSPWKKYTSGDDYITLPSQGAYYFICSIPGHCGAGMKLAVYVQ